MAQELRVLGGLYGSVSGSIFVREYFYPTVLHTQSRSMYNTFLRVSSASPSFSPFQPLSCAPFPDIAAPVADVSASLTLDCANPRTVR